MTIFKTGNMWNRFGEVELFCITTNGTFKADGSLVMGAGIALQATKRFPPGRLEEIAGERFKAYYQNSYELPLMYVSDTQEIDQTMGLFHVKYHWNEPASIELIKYSTVRLFRYIANYPKMTVCLNFPGIGYGKLKRDKVLPIIELLPDNVEVWEYE